MTDEVISVLPYNATTLERAAEAATARVAAVPVRVREMWNPDTCPDAQLPWLAWALSVDEWDPAWTDAQKRSAIKASFAVHQRKGTVGAVKLALEALGFGTEVIEWFQQSPAGAPYTFGIDVDFSDRPLEIAVLDEAERIAVSAKNVRSHLTKVRGIGSVRGKVHFGMAMMSGEDTTVEPFKLTELATAVKLFLSGAAVSSEQTDVLPPSTPAHLFRNGELGAFLDPGDLTPEKVAWRRNLLNDSDNPSGWSSVFSGTGVAPVITAAVATAPDGSPAHRVQLNKGAGTTSSDWASVHFPATNAVSVGAPIVESVWIRSNTAQSFVLQLRDDGALGAFGRLITVTPEWQRLTLSGPAANTSPATCRLWLRGSVGGTSDTADILVAGPQIEVGAAATAYQRISANPSGDFRRAFPNHTLWFGGIDPRPVTRLGQTVGVVLNGARSWQRIVQPVDRFPILAEGTTPPTVNAADTYLSEQCVSVTFPVLGSGGFAVSRANSTVIGGAARHPVVAGSAYRQSYRIALSRRLTGSEQIQVYTTGAGGGDSAVLTPGTPAGVWLDFEHETMLPRAPTSGFNAMYAFANSALTAPVTVYVRRYAVDERPATMAFQDTGANRPTIEARRNLLTATEFAAGIGDAPTRGGLVTAAAMSGYSGALAFGHDGVQSSFAYKSQATISGIAYTLSVVVEMADLLAPSFAVGTESSGNQTFALTVNGAAIPPSTYTVTNLGNGRFRVAGTAVSTGASSNVGVVKYATNNNRTFRVTAYQLELGTVATAYQRVISATDYADVGAPRVFRTDGSNDLLETAALIPHDANMTAVVALRHAVSSTYPRGILSVRGNNANDEGLVLALTTGNQVTPRAYGTEVAYASAPANEPLIITASKVQATRTRRIRVRRNAGQVAEATDSSAFVTTPAASANVPLRVGANLAGTQHMAADYAGALLINRELTTLELANVERYFAARSGMTY